MFVRDSFIHEPDIAFSLLKLQYCKAKAILTLLGRAIFVGTSSNIL
jgi:hypothetical protein